MSVIDVHAQMMILDRVDLIRKSGSFLISLTIYGYF